MSFQYSFEFLLLIHLVPINFGLQCYQCNSSYSLECVEIFPDDAQLIAESCDYIYDAKHCIKMTGISGGYLGTRRFCSSRNWGSYCEYLTRPGDTLQYRSCVYTCSTDSCNRSSKLFPVTEIHFIILFIFMFLVCNL